MTDRPAAMAAIKAYRCEIDLSPGTAMVPRTERAGATVTSCAIRTIAHYIVPTADERIEIRQKRLC
jgi:hypothetical protein